MVAMQDRAGQAEAERDLKHIVQAQGRRGKAMLGVVDCIAAAILPAEAEARELQDKHIKAAQLVETAVAD
jgi:hypothetical protein